MMKTIKIKASEIRLAIQRASMVSDNWQATALEILLLPKINRRWAELNLRKGLAARTLARIDGKPHKGFTFEMNLAVGAEKGWAQFAGYVLSSWNSVRDDWFSHGPSGAWNGVQRETIHQFVQDLLTLYSARHGSQAGTYRPGQSCVDAVRACGIEYVDDL